jgi:putative transcriptional regulator
MTIHAAQYLNRQLLIAMPTMQDNNFARTVTFVCQHSAEGAMGILINRMTDLKLGDILSQMSLHTDDTAITNIPIYHGGPVQRERGFVLHETGQTWESSFEVGEGLAITTSRDILIAFAEGRGPKKSLIALGYAGWSAGQLESEVRENIWLTAQATSDLIFDKPIEQRWEAATRSVGIDPSVLTDYAGHA